MVRIMQPHLRRLANKYSSSCCCCCCSSSRTKPTCANPSPAQSSSSRSTCSRVRSGATTVAPSRSSSRATALPTVLLPSASNTEQLARAHGTGGVAAVGRRPLGGASEMQGQCMEATPACVRSPKRTQSAAHLPQCRSCPPGFGGVTQPSLLELGHSCGAACVRQGLSLSQEKQRANREGQALPPHMS